MAPFLFWMEGGLCSVRNFVLLLWCVSCFGKTAVFINIYMFENMVTRYGDLVVKRELLRLSDGVTRSKSPPSRTVENRRARVQVWFYIKNLWFQWTSRALHYCHPAQRPPPPVGSGQQAVLGRRPGPPHMGSVLLGIGVAWHLPCLFSPLEGEFTYTGIPLGPAAGHPGFGGEDPGFIKYIYIYVYISPIPKREYTSFLRRITITVTEHI